MVLHMNQEEQWLLKEKYNGEKCEAFFTDLELLQSGTPLAYLIGSIPFLGCTIHLNSHPLIPRPETEFWTEKAINTIITFIKSLPENKTSNVLDLCAGSGAIGVAVAKNIPIAQVTFGEIDQAHLPTIKKNLIVNNIPSAQCKVIGSDLFTHISGKFDFILSNPPYINPEIDRTELSVKEFEPHEALYGGKDGMEYINQIIELSHFHLEKHGQLWIEHEPEQTIQIQAYAEKSNFACTTKLDQYGVERYSILVLQ